MGKVAEYDKIWKGICGKQKQYHRQQICRAKTMNIVEIYVILS